MNRITKKHAALIESPISGTAVVECLKASLILGIGLSARDHLIRWPNLSVVDGHRLSFPASNSLPKLNPVPNVETGLPQ